MLFNYFTSVYHLTRLYESVQEPYLHKRKTTPPKDMGDTYEAFSKFCDKFHEMKDEFTEKEKELIRLAEEKNPENPHHGEILRLMGKESYKASEEFEKEDVRLLTEYEKKIQESPVDYYADYVLMKERDEKISELKKKLRQDRKEIKMKYYKMLQESPDWKDFFKEMEEAIEKFKEDNKGILDVFA